MVAEVQVEREAVIQATADPVCWFRFWVVIFTGGVVAVAAGITLMAETEASEVVVAGLSAQLTEERD